MERYERGRCAAYAGNVGAGGGYTGYGCDPCSVNLNWPAQPARNARMYPVACGEVLVIMRYKKDMDRRMRNCLVRMKCRIKQPGTEGTVLGVAGDVVVLESSGVSDWGKRSDEWCIALFFFPDEHKARLWYNSEPELRQPDFIPPSTRVQLFAVRLRYLPQPGKTTYFWQEFTNVRDKGSLQASYIDPTARLLDDNNVNHGLAFAPDPVNTGSKMFRLKESWIPIGSDTFIVLSAFNSEECFKSFFCSSEFAQLRNRKNENCQAVSLLFNIDPDVTGPPCYSY